MVRRGAVVQVLVYIKCNPVNEWRDVELVGELKRLETSVLMYCGRAANALEVPIVSGVWTSLMLGGRRIQGLKCTFPGWARIGGCTSFAEGSLVQGPACSVMDHPERRARQHDAS